MSELRQTWVEPVGTIGFRVMIDGGCFGRRSIGFWHNAVDANAVALEHFERSMALNEIVAENVGDGAELPTLSLKLWEVSNAKAT
ncbi:hypothetical protein AAG612_03110 [Citromicrobium bathyomarinum]|uniref:hypothetical protein n=1 Tax=Citromicrobium bathyomarinum TaxID=72174 RepID=UPI00315AAAFC